jgi:sugar-specific transcriptional regulator TrmB
MFNQILEEIGLSSREAEVYQLLLAKGESPVAAIIGETHAHPQLIYRALKSLAEKGLATVTYRRHRRYIRAEDPKVLEELESARLRKVRQAVPDLRALQGAPEDAATRISRGNEAVRSLRIRSIEELKEGESMYIIGASGDRYYEVMGALHAEIESRRIQKGIRKRMIAYEGQRSDLEKNDTFRQGSEFRYLDRHDQVPSSTNIFGATVANLIWLPDPIVVTVESREVAESYVRYFEELWKAGRE